MALAHPFFDGVESLVEGCAAATTPTPMLTPAQHEGPRITLSAAEWERRLCLHFDELRSGMPPQLTETVLRHTESVLKTEGVSDATPNALVSAVRQDLSSALRQRDEAIRALQQRLVNEAHQHQLPCETRPNGEGGGHTPALGSSEVGGGEAARVAAQQLADVKEAQRLLSEALAEKAELAARVKTAQRQLDGAMANASTRAGISDETASVMEDSESSRGPIFGRRAPPMPTRQGTHDPSNANGVSPAIRKAPMQLQTDNLGQVAPLGTFSPGSDAAGSPAGGQARAASSRLAPRS